MTRLTWKLVAAGVSLVMGATALAQDKIYSPTVEVSEFYRQGKTIFNTSITDDGQRHYYTDNNAHARADNSPTQLWERDTSGARPIMLPQINIPADLHIGSDGKTLYFTEFGVDHSRIYTMQRIDDNQWSTPKLFEAINLPKGSGYPTTTRNGEVVFSSDGDIHWYDGKTVTLLPPSINSEEGEHDPFVARDGSFVIFVRQQPEIGDSNMYISFRQANGWSDAIRLPAPFNQDKVDGSPYVTPDEEYLFFTSNRHGEGLRTYQAPFKAWLEKTRAHTGGQKNAP